MSDLKVGDQVEIIYHGNSAYNGKKGKVIFVGTSLKQGTDMLQHNMDLPDKETRLIVTLNDGAIVNDVREVQLRKL